MTLTLGSGPFSGHPGGDFNFRVDAPKHILYFEDSPRRVRVRLGGETIADTRAAKLMHETGHMPVIYFPQDAVRIDLLEPTDHSTHCPFKGDASYWTVRAADREAENAVWSYSDPLEGAPPIRGYMAFRFDAMDTWLEEDEPIFGHPRDPYHRVDVREGSDHVRVLAGGELLADTARPKLLFETGLPVRWYIPPDDVRTDLLTNSDTTTVCPYKGLAHYLTLAAGDRSIEDLAFGYSEPFSEAVKVRDHFCFLHHELEVEVSDSPGDG